MHTERKANSPVNAESSDDDIRDQAREIHEVEGDTDIDLDAEVKKYDKAYGHEYPGAYVQAWVWVPFGEEGRSCSHRADKDCMICSDCGRCSDSLDGDDNCADCHEGPEEVFPERLVEFEAFLRQLAAMTKDGEEVEGAEPFDLTNDDAMSTLHWAIDMARELMEEEGS